MEMSSHSDADVSARLAALETAINAMTETMAEQNNLLTMIKDAVEPAIEGLKNSAIGSMLGIR